MTREKRAFGKGEHDDTGALHTAVTASGPGGPAAPDRSRRCTVSGAFVISLDFELLWGVRDHADRSSYGRNILGGRAAIPRMLDLFERHGVRAT